MIKYLNTQIVFKEIPNEISLAINITNCPNNCIGCHSPILKQDIGTELNSETLQTLIEKNAGITCVLFMGGDADRLGLVKLAKFIKRNYNLKVGYYSGLDHFTQLDLQYFDYVKLGPYKQDRGGLDSIYTNQILYKINPIDAEIYIYAVDNITNKFWKN
jgi:anaerobic ribonucleoside-triphosphate reductase activating protein